jgi:glycine cleavage system H protein
MSTNIPETLKYTAEHEWIDIKGDEAFIGITDFAQSSLGDVVYVEVPDTGKTIKANDPFGVVESIKSVSDLYAPVSGTVLAKNTDVEQKPELLNQDSYKNWLIKIKIANASELTSLLSASDYKKQVAGK